MPQVVFANNAQSSLSASIAATATVANLQGGTGVLFPVPAAGQFFVGTFVDAATGLLTEIVHVTQVVGDVITMVRGQEGTAPQPWTAGDPFAELWTAGQCRSMLQVGDNQSGASTFGVDTGIANAYVCALNPVLAVNVIGMSIRLQIANTNTGASTFDPGTGPAAIRRRDGTALIGGEMQAGDIPELKWTGSQWRLSYLAPATAAAFAAGTDTESAVTPAQALSLANAIFTSSVLGYCGNVAPAGWLLCFGQAISRSAFAALYAALGGAASPFGQGDGSTTFNVPDLRGRVIAGPDNMGGTVANRLGGGRPGGFTGAAVLGAANGEQSHILDLTELTPHNHTVVGSVNTGSSGGGTPVANPQTNTTSTTGGGLAFNIVQPTLLINYIIKT